MNQYAILARDHWRTHLPQRYRELSDPEAFFTRLGEQAMEEIDTLALALEGQDPVGETFLAKTQRLNAARAQAESTVLRELILLPAQPDQPADQDDQPQAQPPARM
jgi:hypothetical protein